MLVGGWWLFGCMNTSVGSWVIVVGCMHDVSIVGWLGGCMNGSVGRWVVVEWIYECVGTWVVIEWLYGWMYL